MVFTGLVHQHRGRACSSRASVLLSLGQNSSLAPSTIPAARAARHNGRVRLWQPGRHSHCCLSPAHGRGRLGVAPTRSVPPLPSPCGRMAMARCTTADTRACISQASYGTCWKHDFGVRRLRARMESSGGRISDARPAAARYSTAAAASRGKQGLSRSDLSIVIMRRGVAHMYLKTLLQSEQGPASHEMQQCRDHQSVTDRSLCHCSCDFRAFQIRPRSARRPAIAASPPTCQTRLGNEIDHVMQGLRCCEPS